MAACTRALVLAIHVVGMQAAHSEVQRRDTIERKIAASVQASPKNEFGRLELEVASRVVQRYFAREHAWQTSSGELVVKAVREASRGGRGLSAGDVVKAVESVERSVPDALLSPPSTASTMVHCAATKGALVNISHSGTGRIPLEVFAASHVAASTADAAVLDSSIYLSRGGAVEPHVLIANFMSSSAQCSSGPFRGQCCVSECEHIMNALERKMQAPLAEPERLFQAVAQVSTRHGGAARVLPHILRAKLFAIAAEHDGDVPLHGETFAEWLHYAFPTECPLPSGSASFADKRVRPDEERVSEDTPRAVAGHPYTVAMMLAEYTGAGPDANSWPSKAGHRSTRQDVGRLVIMVLMGFAMLRTALAYIGAASFTLRGVAKDSDPKKPQQSDVGNAVQ